MNIPLDEELSALFTAAADRAAAAYFASLPPPDCWLTLPEAAAYAKMTPGHMRLLVLGRPYRAASAGKAERPAVLPRIERGETGFAKGARVRQSAVDAYLERHKYRQ
ncbi:hypothetical protein GCM10023172_23100 [Hymenobacter ginsengisoli]|uniref:DNA-binding protein n=1 Tax=Hymenobacter ginsengisoli TaxID=1051626 RepID=A0ABP8QFM2_9BACT|nr:MULTISPECIES: hypothetical protein [unclassified Hymenobacter]MBO2031926.1 hypothetical protein [Hymenobacter sp. BT559]